MRRDGFVLPLALVVLVAASFMVATAMQVSLSDYHANRGARLAAHSLFAAEAGVHRTLGAWSTMPYSTLAPGQEVTSGWVSLPDGSDYQTVVTRVDDGTSADPLFRVLSEGRPSRNSTARRMVVAMIRGGLGGSACCDAALSVYGRLNATSYGPGGTASAPSEAIDGRDTRPALWTTYCPAPGAANTGVEIARAVDLTIGSNVRVAGTPATRVDATVTTNNVVTFGGTTYAALAAQADIIITQSNPKYTDTYPRATGGTCTTSNTRNWGAPELPGSACWSYLPIVWAQNNLRLGGTGTTNGQGILLVDGDLTLMDDFHFYGLVVVQGNLTMQDRSSIVGAVLTGNNGVLTQQARVQNQSYIDFSSCAMTRAFPRSSAAAPLPGRHWFEIS